MGKNSVIESNVTIIGPVVIGDNCKIDLNPKAKETMIIGPNTSIGNNSVISAVKIENSIIMDNCKIDSTTTIKDSIISSNSEIKDNCLDDDRIFLLGEGSKITLWEILESN